MCWASRHADETEHEQGAVDALRAENARLKEKCEALEELVDCLEESTDGYWREHDDKLLAARARLDELGE